MSEKLSAPRKVVSLIKERVLNGTFPVDTLLPSEDALTDLLGVSRVALREGIKQLEALGWLRIERGTGTRVIRPDFSVLAHSIDFMTRFEILRFDHVHQLRSLIEIEIVGELARHCPHETLIALRQCNRAIITHFDSPVGYVDADVAFHDLLLATSANPLYPMLMGGFRDYLVASRRLSYAGPDAVHASAAEHNAILDAIADQDEVRARALATAHLSTVSRHLRERRQDPR